LRGCSRPLRRGVPVTQTRNCATRTADPQNTKKDVSGRAATIGWALSAKRTASVKCFPKLKELAARKSGRLSGCEQEMLAIGRALVGNPKLILVDESSQGLAPIIVIELFYSSNRTRCWR
jgi:ABC-type branched-subunit amino acid transport system ATPase component